MTNLELFQKLHPEWSGAKIMFCVCPDVIRVDCLKTKIDAPCNADCDACLRMTAKIDGIPIHDITVEDGKIVAVEFDAEPIREKGGDGHDDQDTAEATKP